MDTFIRWKQVIIVCSRSRNLRQANLFTNQKHLTAHYLPHYLWDPLVDHDQHKGHSYLKSLVSPIILQVVTFWLWMTGQPEVDFLYIISYIIYITIIITSFVLEAALPRWLHNRYLSALLSSRRKENLIKAECVKKWASKYILSGLLESFLMISKPKLKTQTFSWKKDWQLNNQTNKRSRNCVTKK